MSLLSGNLSIVRYVVLGPVLSEDDVINYLSRDSFRPFSDDTQEEQIGWVDWRNPLIAPPEANYVFQDKYAVFSLRIDTRKVPPVLAKYYMELRIQKLKTDKQLAFIGKEARLAIHDEVVQELLPKTLPVPRFVEVVWEMKSGLLYALNGSKKLNNLLIEKFFKTFGLEISPQLPIVLIQRMFEPNAIERIESLIQSV